jgi:serine/threonine-protein kinase
VSDERIGKLIGDRFRLTSRIGQGGMGVVYLAADGQTSGKAAVKFLHQHLVERSDFAARFRQEARSASRFTHEYAVKILADGEDEDGVPWLAMEYCPGLSLKQILRQETQLSVPRACRIAEQILEALAEAHKNGIVHRDLKPENIKVERGEGAKETTKILDFGVAKFVGTDEVDEMTGAVKTKTGVVFGTPKYMSPEQILGEKVDGRADIYSAGAILYEMLAGSPPFPSDDIMGFVTKHLKEAVEPPSVRAPDRTIPEEVEEIILEMLAKDREARPARAAEVAERLEPFTEEAAMPEEEVEAPARGRRLLFLAGGVAGGAAAGLVVSGHFVTALLLGILMGAGATAAVFVAPRVGEVAFLLRTLVVTAAMGLMALAGWLVGGDPFPVVLSMALAMVLVWVCFSAGWGRRNRPMAVLLGGVVAPLLAIVLFPYLEGTEYRRLWDLDAVDMVTVGPAVAVAVVAVLFSLTAFVAPLPLVRKGR